MTFLRLIPPATEIDNDTRYLWQVVMHDLPLIEAVNGFVQACGCTPTGALVDPADAAGRAAARLAIDAAIVDILRRARARERRTDEVHRLRDEVTRLMAQLVAAGDALVIAARERDALRAEVEARRPRGDA